jgi:drug/metabolite transporter (DMT)-like permease
VDESVAVRRQRWLVVTAVLVTVVLWASAFVGIRSASRYLPPGALAFGRLAVASLALGAIMLVRREPLPPRRLLPGIAACGVLWFGMYNVVLNEAERHVDAGTAAMLVNVGPIFIAILAGLFLREGFPRPLILGVLVSFSGVVVIGLATSKHGIAPSWAAGLCVLAALLYAGGVVIQKPLLAHASALQITFGACVAGMLSCTPFAPQLANSLPSAPTSAILCMVYLAIAPMAIGFLTWAYALARTSAGKLGTSTYLVPPIAILLGWILLGEAPPVLAYVGGALCLAGVWAARRAPRQHRAPAPTATVDTTV